jgi:hypothetical protein
LNIWNNNIKDAITHDNIAHKEWKEAGKPKCPQNPLVLQKIETRNLYRFVVSLLPYHLIEYFLVMSLGISCWWILNLFCESKSDFFHSYIKTRETNMTPKTIEE